MLSNERFLIRMVGVLSAVFIALLSVLVLSKRVPEAELFKTSAESLDETKETVMGLSAATLTVSVGITLLPDDYASPIANTLADLSKYFVLILGVVFLEKLKVLEGIPITFIYVIPAVCGLAALFFITGKEVFKSLAKKLLIIAIAFIFVVPVSTGLSQYLGEGYMSYVQETISVAEVGSDKIEEISEPRDGEESIYERISSVFQTAIQGVSDLFDYFSAIVKKCINSIAILIVVTCAIPFLTFMFFIWLIRQLFEIPTLRSL